MACQFLHNQSSSHSSSAMDMEIVAEQRRTRVLECEGESQANNINIADGEKKSSEILESEAAMMDQMKRVRGAETEANFAKGEESSMAKHIKSLIQGSLSHRLTSVKCLVRWWVYGACVCGIRWVSPTMCTWLSLDLAGAPSWLIFSDPALKSIQQQTLKCHPHPKDQADSTCAVDGQKGKPTEDQISQISGAAISWHLDLEHVP